MDWSLSPPPLNSVRFFIIIIDRFELSSHYISWKLFWHNLIWNCFWKIWSRIPFTTLLRVCDSLCSRCDSKFKARWCVWGTGWCLLFLDCSHMFQMILIKQKNKNCWKKCCNRNKSINGIVVFIYFFKLIQSLSCPIMSSCPNMSRPHFDMQNKIELFFKEEYNSEFFHIKFDTLCTSDAFNIRYII